MNRSTLFVLIALNTLFAVVLVGEWYAESETTNIQQSPSKTDETEGEELPSLDLTETSEDSYSDLVERPLFIKGRKPVDEPIPETVPVAAVKKVEAFVWELTGIFVTPKGSTAFFSRINTKVPKDNYRKQKLGDELDGWKISDIHTDNVTLTQAGETKILLLRKVKNKMPLPMGMNGNNRIPPLQQPPIPQQNLQQSLQQGMPPQNLQIPDASQNVEPPADESVEPIQQ